MSDIVGFHSQLASIMEVLANAAVAEICKLVDDGYALLRWEMSQSQKENEQLRRKLRVMEMKMSKGCSERGRVPSSPGDNQKAESNETVLEASLIRKEPRKEGRQRPPQETVQSIADGNEKAAALDEETSPGKSTEELADEHRSSHGAWEVSGLETVLKAEPEKESVKQRPLLTGTECRAEGVSGLACEFTVCQRAGHLGSCFTPGSSGPEPGDSSYAADMDSEGLSTQTLPPAETSGASSLSSLGATDVKPDIIVDSLTIKLEGDMQSAWNKEATLGKAHTQPQFYREDGEQEGIQPEIVASMYPAHNQTVENTISECDEPDRSEYAAFLMSDTPESQHSLGTAERGFICRFCGMSFSRLKKFEEHQRGHTGEKPFSCVHCGKQFSQSCNLKMHQSIHTGKRQFPCVQCGKSFMSSRDLKVHQNVHTGERPFCCVMCGRSFSHPSNLKRHQRRCSPRKCSPYPLSNRTALKRDLEIPLK
ncbi:uncharacterized protein [Paramormyrops kingsleyae]|uniref:uncharacterized protein isoform X6 n=1 Tax=Paramormyrops kingsleyae TaxID=1676925 RepID=UPI000CD64CE4|nr:zinc finger protein 260-like isoform X6 [Paramormyrops kingsleyae]